MWPPGLNYPDSIETIYHGHPDVHQDDVRLEDWRLRDRFLAVGGLPHHLEVRLGAE